MTFANPKESAKYHDNFNYRAGVNMEQAKAERRNAETASHMGRNPYGNVDDVSSGKYEGPVR